jgi:arylsulfatase A-like enzyme
VIRHLRFVLVLAFCWAVCGHAVGAPSRPHIIFIFTDDFGYGDLGSYGGQFVPTPNLDRMAREGIRFTQFYVASPICSPSRTGVTTGMFPARWRITSYLQTRKGNAECGQADFLDPQAPSLARLLKSGGYATAHIGKWHMGGGRDVTNAPSILRYGFDECVSTYESPNPHPDITATNWIWSAHDKVKRWDRTAFFVDKTLDFLRRHPDQPCYVNLWPDDTHTPFVPSAEVKRKHEAGNNAAGERNFKGVLEEYDRQMGRLLDGLRQLGMATNTLVLFTGDNGPMPTYDGRRTAGLRGSKLSLYEGGIRLPFLAWWPGRAPANRVDDRTVLAAVDLLPSLCQVAGASIPAEVAARLDGEDLSAAFTGGASLRTKSLFWEYGRNTNSFAYPKEPKDCSPNVAVREGRWKLLVNADGSGAALYDIEADPKETKNVAAENADVTRRLSEAALQWRKSLPTTAQVPSITRTLQSAENSPRIDADREMRSIAGWTVQVSTSLLATNAEATRRALELLTAQLEEIVRVVPKSAVAELQKVPLWVSPEYPGSRPRAEYHPDAGWLREHGREPAMAKAVEFTNVRIFEEETRRMPNFALHELAHAYHDRVLGFEEPRVKSAYATARAGGRYDKVERRDAKGRETTERAYAMTDHKEYFAEGSEAFFSTNDFFPFTRNELKGHDPEMFQLLESLWAVDQSTKQ